MSLSPAQQLAQLPEDQREQVLAGQDCEALMQDWRFWARPEQLAPPGDWRIWLVKTGRGWGKTRTGSEWCADRAQQGYEVGALVHRTAGETRDVMIEGRSGVEAVCERRKLHCKYEPSKRRVTIRVPGVGARHTMRWTSYSAVEPDLLAGPEHDSAWVDEGASHGRVVDGAGRSAWDNLMFGLRVSRDPRAVLTTTPRSTVFMRKLMAREDVVVTHGALYDNIANLAPAFVSEIVGEYEGSRLGRQEIWGQMLEALGSMFQRGWFEILPRHQSPVTSSWQTIRSWDLAATEVSDVNPNPDWTVGGKVSYNPRKRLYCVEHVVRGRWSAGKRDRVIKRTAKDDGYQCAQWFEKEPGASGKSQIEYLRSMLDGIGRARGWPPSGSKTVRAELSATAAENGRLILLEDEWNTSFLDEHEEFGPDCDHDDQVDMLSQAIAVFRNRRGARGVADPSERAQARAQHSTYAHG